MSATDSTPAKAANIDWISALLALAASLLIAVSGYGWLMGSSNGETKPERPSVASIPPPLRLIDPITGEPVVLIGLQGKVVWVSFISAASKNAQADYDALSKVWKGLHLHRKFAMAVVASPSEDRAAIKGLIRAASEKLPTYIAAKETAAAYGVNASNLPFHLVLDPSGKVGAIGGEGMIDRLAKDATQWLEEIEPSGWTRFARAD